MRTSALLFVIAVLFAAVVSAQPANGVQVIYLTQVTAPRNLTELNNAVRSVADIRDMTVDEAKKALTAHGTAEQIALAQWLCGELDKASPAPAFTKRQLLTADSRNPAVAVFFLAHTGTPQAMQEAVNAVRSVTDILRCFPVNAAKAVVARGTLDQIVLAEWILTELDAPAQTIQSPVMRDHPVVGQDPRSGTVAQVFFLAHTQAPAEVQESVNMARSLADMQRLFPYNARNLLVMRGSPEQIAFADWLLTEMDKPAPRAPGPASLDFTVSGDPRMGNQVRLVFLTHGASSQEASQEMIAEVRATAKTLRVFYNSSRNTVGLRGTGDQVARAGQLIQERDRP